MVILGLSAYAHESSCALLRNGVLIAHAEEERFNREKHTSAFPAQAIAYCLREGGIGMAQVDQIAFFWQPWREIAGNISHMLRFFPASIQLLSAESGGGGLPFLSRFRSMLGVGGMIRREFGLERAPEITFIEHHVAHAASAFYPSGFREAAILTLDGRGEATSTMISKGGEAGIQKLQEFKVPHSIGHLFAAITEYLGFRPFSDEWKVMGMAAYGRSTYLKQFENILQVRDSGEYSLNLSYFRFHLEGSRRWLADKFLDEFGPPFPAGGTFSQRAADIAFALQYVVERAGVALAKRARVLSGSENLCVAGGVALNCLMNRSIVEESGFRNFFFQPLAGDSGASFGAALEVDRRLNGGQLAGKMDNVFWGPAFSDEDVEVLLQSRGLIYRRAENIAAETAEAIAQGEVVGWFQGRMESGPRALGGRSILADPTRADTKQRLNARVKKREEFRPFAPAVPEERAEEFFLLPGGQPSPFMILAGRVRPEKQPMLPAVTHVDGSARVQTVSRAANPLFWKLLEEFGKIRGVPVLLNTSFNENEPIVCSPQEAIDCFLRTDFDRLAIGNYLVKKPLGSSLRA
jgi:carbamoyltransferase